MLSKSLSASNQISKFLFSLDVCGILACLDLRSVNSRCLVKRSLSTVKQHCTPQDQLQSQRKNAKMHARVDLIRARVYVERSSRAVKMKPNGLVLKENDIWHTKVTMTNEYKQISFARGAFPTSRNKPLFISPFASLRFMRIWTQMSNFYQYLNF